MSCEKGIVMSLIVVYFHGYGSSPNSQKVLTLREQLNCPVYCFPADVDPQKAVDLISYNIDLVLLEDMHKDDQLLFIGTSLGGWLASKMAAMYKVPAIIINPSTNPRESLKKYGVAPAILEKYDELVLSDKNTYFFADKDEVIDHTAIRKELTDKGIMFNVAFDADHRYQGPAFDRVIQHIKNNFQKN